MSKSNLIINMKFFEVLKISFSKRSLIVLCGEVPSYVSGNWYFSENRCNKNYVNVIGKNGEPHHTSHWIERSKNQARVSSYIV